MRTWNLAGRPHTKSCSRLQFYARILKDLRRREPVITGACVFMLQLCRADVQTYCFGLAASMGAFLLGAGAKGKRYSMPNARIMIHQPLGGASGQAVDIEIQAKEIMYHKANLNRIMAECTGQPIEKVPFASCAHVPACAGIANAHCWWQ